MDPASVTVLGLVESEKGESSDRGESTPAKKKTTSHKSPKKSTKAGKTSEYQSDLKSLDDKWSESFACLEALFLAKNFQVPVEPVQSSSVVVSDKPFIPPEQQSSSQTSTSGATGQMMKATQPVVPYYVAVSGPEIQPPGPASQILPGTSGRLEVQPPGPTGQPATTTNQSTSLTGVPVPSYELVSDEERLSDHSSPSLDEEGVVNFLMQSK